MKKKTLGRPNRQTENLEPASARPGLIGTSKPQRTCIGCGKKRSQHELMRVAAINGETPFLNVRKRSVGRGAYLCRDLHCVERAWSRRALERGLKLKQSPPPAMKLELLEAAVKPFSLR
jgi:predicted RNA-binding protein YlxR (DUF448 family)